jgi:biotin carboxyl carrier protein
MRRPQTTRDHVATLAQEAAIAFNARTQQLRSFRNLPFHLGQQGIADIGVKGRGIGMAGGRGRHRDSAAGALMQAERIRGPGKLQIDQMKAIRNHKSYRSRQLLGDILQPQPDQVAQLQPAHHRGAHRHGTWPDAVFLIAGQINELPDPGQRVGQARHGGARQAAAVGNLQIAEPRLVALEAAQHVEGARHDLNDIAIAVKIAGEHSLLAEPFRASSHRLCPLFILRRHCEERSDEAIQSCSSGLLRGACHRAALRADPLARNDVSAIPHRGIKFHLQNKLPQAICRHNSKPFARAIVRQTVPWENGMPEIRIVTEVAGRVCALPFEAGSRVSDGDDIVFVEAMKMEIPVASPAAGKLKSILVKIDDLVAEGQVVAIIET